MITNKRKYQVNSGRSRYYHVQSSSIGIQSLSNRCPIATQSLSDRYPIVDDRIGNAGRRSYVVIGGSGPREDGAPEYRKCSVEFISGLR
jgi:hypothetical protein